ncbi:DUF222 domain-containing protein [Demequina aurantiaca]|uniref:HNH endonuclease signature motif containing protein n=1 Tax=Demequina aurantiaca TaxID=676200 RepID=UPI003D34C7F5
MTILTSSLAREVTLLRAFEGRAESELSKSELDDLREAVGGARRALDVVAATMAGEVGRRSAPELGVGGMARKEGFSTPQQLIAKTLGTSPGDAGRLIAMGQALRNESGGELSDTPEGEVAGPVSGAAAQPTDGPRYPHLAAAIAAGILGAEQAALIKRTLDACREAMLADLDARFVTTRRGASAERSGAQLVRMAISSGSASPDPSTGAGEEDDGAGRSGGAGRPEHQEARAAVLKRLDELEQRLVAKAPTLRLADLRRVCDRERAWCSPKELAVKERRHVENRALFFGEDADGMMTMTARMDAASAAPIKAWVDAQTKWAFQQRRDLSEGGGGIFDARQPGQIRLDALASLARHGLDCKQPTSGVKTTVVVRLDEKDLRERVDDLGNGVDLGEGALGECDQLSGPVTVATLRSMAVDAGVVPVTLGGTSLPLDIGRLDRIFTAAQRIALIERDGGCSWCHAPPSFCEAHHIKWWARDNGRTDIDNGVMLCTGCHHRIHRDGWGIEIRRGDVWFTPPPGVTSEASPRIGGKAHLALGAVAPRAA